MKRNLVIALSILALAVGTAGAQVEVSPGVARVSLMHGDVSSQRGDTGDWAAAALNQPVVAGDSISTGDRSRAEVQLDHANILRLGNNSQAKVATLTRTQMQVQVGRGLAYYSIFKESEAQVEIDTPNVAIRPTSKDGVYRLQVDGSETQVVVRKGSADISTPQGSARLEKGQSAVIRGTADEAEYKLAGAPSKDGWDSWNNERDSTIRNAQSWSHTNSYYVGSEDLDAYGHWENVPDYGMVWAPVVAAGWAPYRAGRWLWEPYWGWTWTSYEPWGWAPYHYGRWMYWNTSWVWWPGPVTPYYRPFWAPAYVSFFGFGGGGWGFGFGFGGGWGFGNVGWLPIGPCDHFYPWWGRHGSRFNAVNFANIHKGHNFGGIGPLHGGHKFSNLRLAGTDPHVREGISTLPTDHFGTGRGAAKPMGAEAFREARLMTGNLPLVPTRENLSATNRAASATTTKGGPGQQRFFTHNQPAAPLSFEHQQAQMQQAIKRDPQFAGRGQSAGQSTATDGSRSAASGGGKDKNDAQPAQSMRSAGPGSGNVSGNEAGWRRFASNNELESQNRPPHNAETANAPNRSSAAASVTNRSEAPRQNQETNSDRYGWHKFSGSQSDGGAVPANNRNSGAAARAAAGEMRSAPPVNTAPARSEAAPDRGAGWQKFTPQNSSVESGRPINSGGQSERYTPPPANENRGASNYARESRSSGYRDSSAGSRPPLNLRQPIVTPRSSGGGVSSGGGRGGGYSAPARSSGGGGGGSRSGSSGGGGGSRGGSSGGGGSHSGHSR